jgi:hypothetical protein
MQYIAPIPRNKRKEKKWQSPRKRKWNVYVREYVKKEWGIGLGKRKAKGCCDY